MNKDNIKALVVIIIIFITCIVLVLIFNKEKNSEQIKVVTDYNQFFSVSNIINDYLQYNENNDEEGIYYLLDKTFIEKEEITEENVLNKIEIYPKDTSMSIKKIEYVELNNNNIYYVEGSLIKNNYDQEEEIKEKISIIVIVDYKNLSIAVYPLKENENYKIVMDNIKKINIQKNSYNELKGTGIINEERLCALYLSDYVNKMNNKINEAYELLDNTMKEKYTTINSFAKFIRDNQDKITNSADKCYVNEYSGKRNYSIIDKNNNEYIFSENGIMNYTVKIKINEQ